MSLFGDFFRVVGDVVTLNVAHLPGDVGTVVGDVAGPVLKAIGTGLGTSQPQHVLVHHLDSTSAFQTAASFTGDPNAAPVPSGATGGYLGEIEAGALSPLTNASEEQAWVTGTFQDSTPAASISLPSPATLADQWAGTSSAGQTPALGQDLSLISAGLEIFSAL
jgi:hypothetical protein